jgi:hypothetical protein
VASVESPSMLLKMIISYLKKHKRTLYLSLVLYRGKTLSLFLLKVYTSRVFKVRMLRRIFGHETEEVTEAEEVSE